MNYSNEGFEIFQRTLAKNVPEDSLLWEIRDALFCEAFYGHKKKVNIFFSLPFGWLIVLIIQLLKSCASELFWRNQISHGKVMPEGEYNYFLFVSGRNNQVNRILSEAPHAEAKCNLIYDRNVIDYLDSSLQDEAFFIRNMWIYNLGLRDVYVSLRLARELHHIFRDKMNGYQLRKIEFYLIQFFAWSRFWRKGLAHSTQSVFSTFEKSAVCKSFYYVGKEKGISPRVHWVHGLRHASLQSTLASQLWVMTDGDCKYFKNKVPSYCEVLQKRSPDADLFIEKAGKVSFSNLERLEVVHFLFLGPGLEASYTKEMRMNDLAIIRRAQEIFSDRISWKFRPHPAAVERFRTELREAGVDISTFSTGELIDDIRWAHAVGSSWSSLLLDVAETGRPIFWVQSEVRTLGAVDELIQDGVGCHIDTSNVDSVLAEVLSL